MATLGTLNDIKQGLAVIYNGEPYKVMQAKFVRMQQRKPVMQTKMKNLINGKVLEYNFKPGDKVETADITRKSVNFLYAAGNEYAFMDNENYEQFSFSKEKLGEQVKFLKDGCAVTLISFNDQPINIELPVKMELKVVSTPEGARGDTAQGKVTKPATVETGVTFNVPLFVKAGDTIKINTETEEYVERV
ncbi:MAG: elongation factor P [Candidatus Buchananbacteria bacterium RIFCSPHIGHO2_02_FULL_38_8]|uniref:Elongation factor P n=1 Tax=Candidatus Buchananbacteria bacterium RIFCSPHIGHO2_02_FULL_38_8 TaxID=1797538 RepID=A0A1G1Y3A0_9BACT|nr:MAG: elongation factor P [Candidatus Buchananbacteria bacterium RIFCSPHIGHO2_02_FULL_38_8]